MKTHARTRARACTRTRTCAHAHAHTHTPNKKWFLHNANPVFFFFFISQLFHGENKLIFNVMMMRPVLNKTNTLSWVCVEIQRTNTCAITYFDNVYYSNRTMGKPTTLKYKISDNTNNQSRKNVKYLTTQTTRAEKYKISDNTNSQSRKI